MKSVQTFETHSADETLALGRELAHILPTEAVVLLLGDLGAGKTMLTKGIVEGRAAALAQDVTSPTFTLIHEYGDPVSVYHIDLYRLETAEQARRLGLDELFTQPALVVMEWGDRFPKLLPPSVFQIRILHAGEDRRLIELLSPD